MVPSTCPPVAFDQSRSLRDRYPSLALRALICVLAMVSVVRAQAPRVGIEQHLGAVLPLNELTFTDEDGKKVVLKDLFDKPVVPRT